MIGRDEVLRVFTAFSGYDSQCMALDRIGVNYELVGWSEIDPNAIAAHNAVYPQWADRNAGDISKIDWGGGNPISIYSPTHLRAKISRMLEGWLEERRDPARAPRFYGNAARPSSPRSRNISLWRM